MTKSDNSNLDALYRDTILRHYRNPHNSGPTDGAQIVVRGSNPACGDRLVVYVKLSGNMLERVSCHRCSGCAICVASASMMTDALRGKTVQDAREFISKFKSMISGVEPLSQFSGSPDMAALESVRKFPVRIKCATLA